MSEIEVALGVSVNKQEEGIMDGFNGRCKFTCFPCCIAREGRSEEKDIECCPECGREAAFIESIIDNKWKPIEFHEKPYKVILTAHAGDLYPVAAFFLIDNHSGEKVWLRDTEGPLRYKGTAGWPTGRAGDGGKNSRSPKERPRKERSGEKYRKLLLSIAWKVYTY